MRHEFTQTQRRVISEEGPSAIESVLEVHELEGPVRDVTVTLDVQHTWTSDLRIMLTAPDGTEVLLVSGEGGSGDNFFQTTFDDSATDSIAGGTAPFNGTFRPEQSLDAFNGKSGQGGWRLRVEDQQWADGGSLESWTLSIESCVFRYESDEPVVISPQSPNTVASPIEIVDVPGLAIQSLRVGVDLEHTWDSDLRISLISPDGTTIPLADRRGGSQDDFRHTVFDDEADKSIAEGHSPFAGSFRPEAPLAALQNHLAIGTWYLQIEDLAPQDGGTLHGWWLEIEAHPFQPRVPSEFDIEVRFLGGLTATQREVFSLAAARWREIITGDIPSVTVEGEVVDDLLILAEGRRIDGPGDILGQAGPTHVRTDSQLPARGIMSFDTGDLTAMELDGSLIDVIIHEMGHVLGVGTLWRNQGLIQGSGTADPVFTGPNARREYAALRGTNDDSAPVPIANTGGPGTREGHWREATFDNELMTGIIDIGTNPLSRLSIACIEDMGYQVNYDAADPYLMPGLTPFRRLMRDTGRRCSTSCAVPAPVVVS